MERTELFRRILGAVFAGCAVVLLVVGAGTTYKVYESEEEVQEFEDVSDVYEPEPGEGGAALEPYDEFDAEPGEFEEDTAALTEGLGELEEGDDELLEENDGLLEEDADDLAEDMGEIEEDDGLLEENGEPIEDDEEFDAEDLSDDEEEDDVDVDALAEEFIQFNETEGDALEDDFEIPPLHWKVREIDLVLYATTYSGIFRRDGRLYAAADPSQAAGKQSCPT